MYPGGREGGRHTVICRRDLLKAVTVPVVAVATGVVTGWANSTAPQDRLIAKGSRIAITTRPLMTVRIGAALPQKLGTVPHGVRSIVPVTGGDFEGPRLETDDHALIYMRFQGLRHGPAAVIAALGRGDIVDPASYYFRTLPAFEASTDTYGFLNRIITVGVGEARPDGAVHRIDEIL
jgi:hypothetical protein